MESITTTSKPIPVRNQLIYSLSELGSNPIYTITLSFLTFFYTDVMGINAGVVGIVILISRVFDGFSDIWAGNLIDHTHAKSGSARPWLLWTAVPLALSYVALFTVPNWSEAGKVIYYLRVIQLCHDAGLYLFQFQHQRTADLYDGRYEEAARRPMRSV